MLQTRIKNRFQAFAVHLLISFLLFLLLAGIIKLFWYPGLLFDVEGGMQGILLIAAVDLVIGPFLTLMVYNIRKPKIKQDLIIIACLQLTCILGGMYTVANSRPLAVVYAHGIYYTTTLARYQGRDIDVNKVTLLQGRKPVWLGVEFPEGMRQDEIWNIYGGADVAVELYQPYKNFLQQLTEESDKKNKREKQFREERERLEKNKPVKAEKINTVIGTLQEKTKESKKDTQEFNEFQLVTRYGYFTVLVNLNSGEWVKITKVLL